MLVARAAMALLAVLGTGSQPGDDEGDLDDVVKLRAVLIEDTGITPSPVLDHLDDGDVLDVTVTDGVPGGRGTVRQCVRTTSGMASCVNDFPVQFGERGDARFQYQLVDTGRCGPARSCVLVVDDAGRTRRAVAHTVFGAPAPPPPVVTVTPGRLFEEGDEVQVVIGALTPGTTVQVGYCEPGCGNFTRVGADPLGLATTSVTIGANCERCGIAVIGGVHDSLTAMPFAPPPQPGYDTSRLTMGLLIAAALLITAWRIVATVDWRPPSEAATPDLDAVEL
ncbi:MAG: hypothetical protein M3337_02405 [Actinomycetota bacterium]|nr:hypothetical protein [Actinomycetota bacterium]